MAKADLLRQIDETVFNNARTRGNAMNTLLKNIVNGGGSDMAEWVSGETYEAGAVVYWNNGIWVSDKDSNTSEPMIPMISSWLEVPLSELEIDHIFVNDDLPESYRDLIYFQIPGVQVSNVNSGISKIDVPLTSGMFVAHVTFFGNFRIRVTQVQSDYPIDSFIDSIMSESPIKATGYDTSQISLGWWNCEYDMSSNESVYLGTSESLYLNTSCPYTELPYGNDDWKLISEVNQPIENITTDVSGIVYVDTVYGNDTTGKIEDMASAFKTISAAVDATIPTGGYMIISVTGPLNLYDIPTDLMNNKVFLESSCSLFLSGSSLNNKITLYGNSKVATQSMNMPSQSDFDLTLFCNDIEFIGNPTISGKLTIFSKIAKYMNFPGFRGTNGRYSLYSDIVYWNQTLSSTLLCNQLNNGSLDFKFDTMYVNSANPFGEEWQSAIAYQNSSNTIVNISGDKIVFDNTPGNIYSALFASYGSTSYLVVNVSVKLLQVNGDASLFTSNATGIPLQLNFVGTNILFMSNHKLVKHGWSSGQRIEFSNSVITSYAPLDQLLFAGDTTASNSWIRFNNTLINLNGAARSNSTPYSLIILSNSNGMDRFSNSSMYVANPDNNLYVVSMTSSLYKVQMLDIKSNIKISNMNISTSIAYEGQSVLPETEIPNMFIGSINGQKCQVPPSSVGHSLVVITDTIEPMFTKYEQHGTPESPVSHHITANLINAIPGMICVFYHNSSTIPAFDPAFKKLQGDYVTNQLNIIEMVYRGGRVEYKIFQD